MALVVSTTQPVSAVKLYTYDNLDTADSSPSAILSDGTSSIAGFIQAIGTFGGGTVKLQGSNNNSTWVDLLDVTGVAIGLTAAGGKEFTTSCVYIRPLITGGTADDVDVFISLRG